MVCLTPFVFLRNVCVCSFLIIFSAIGGVVCPYDDVIVIVVFARDRDAIGLCSRH